MLELAILGLLGEQELHGYEIRKRLREELGFFSPVSFGSLYPALSRLERSGAVESAEVDEVATPAVPMTGSLGGERAALRGRRPGGRGRRGRKVFRITEEGRRQFAALLDDERDTAGDDARSFGLRLALARYLPPPARLRLLERRRAQLLQRLDDVRQAAAGRRALDPYARSVVEHTAESTERDISWLDRLIEAERARVAGPAPAEPDGVPADLEHNLVPTEGSN